MQQDIWINSKTNTTLGITGAFGSPRGWLRRALDVHNLDDTTFHSTSITPPEISVAGIWYKTPDGYGLPITADHRELIRWFDAPPLDRIGMSRVDKKNLVPVIGLCAAVPLSEVLKWIKVYKDHGAAYTWWKAPENKSARASTAEKQRRQLDYVSIYGMLDRGMTAYQIAKELDLPSPNIEYVKKKWAAGAPPTVYKKNICVESLRADYLSGIRAPELALKYNTSESYVYRMIRGVKELKENQ